MSGQSSDGALIALAAIAATVLLLMGAATTFGCDTRGFNASGTVIQETR